MTKSSGTFCFHSPISMTVSSSWYESCRAIFNLKMKINGLLPNPFALLMLVILQDYPLFMFLYVLATKVITHFSDNEKRLTRSWVGGWWTVESTLINIREYFKNGWQHGFEIFWLLKVIIWGCSLKISDPHLQFCGN